MGDHNVVGAVVFALSINATVHQPADQVAGAGCSDIVFSTTNRPQLPAS